MPLWVCGCIDGLAALPQMVAQKAGATTEAPRDKIKGTPQEVAPREWDAAQVPAIMATADDMDGAVHGHWWRSEEQAVDFKHFKWGAKGWKYPYTCWACYATWQCIFDVRNSPATISSAEVDSRGGSIQLVEDPLEVRPQAGLAGSDDVLQTWKVCPSVMLHLRAGAAGPYVCSECQATWQPC